jgi:hypothetical protein
VILVVVYALGQLRLLPPSKCQYHYELHLNNISYVSILQTIIIIAQNKLAGKLKQAKGNGT